MDEQPPRRPAEDVCRALLIFFTSSWGDAKQSEWQRLTGRRASSSRALCDAAREALGLPPVED